MRGKILFFSEEKGFGKIIDSGKNEYFFYINKIKNKPEELKHLGTLEELNKKINKGLATKYNNVKKGVTKNEIIFITCL